MLLEVENKEVRNKMLQRSYELRKIKPSHYHLPEQSEAGLARLL